MVIRPFFQSKRSYNQYMNNLLNKIIPIAFATILTGTYNNIAQAQTEKELLQQIEEYSQSNRQNNIEQVTNVNQLKDVSPTDWSYEAIRSLSDRYGCISGFSDGTYRGNQPITRYEFAAGLNSCFEQIERSLNSSAANDERESIIYERDSLDVQLGTLWGKIDELDSRTMLLEKNQFSPTTKVTGETIFGITSVDGDLNID